MRPLVLLRTWLQVSDLLFFGDVVAAFLGARNCGGTDLFRVFQQRRSDVNIEGWRSAASFCKVQARVAICFSLMVQLQIYGMHLFWFVLAVASFYSKVRTAVVKDAMVATVEIDVGCRYCVEALGGTISTATAVVVSLRRR